MIQKCSNWKVLRAFFDDPSPKEGFTIRYISKQIGLATTSVRLHMKELCKENKHGYPLVIKSKGISYPTYRANRSSELFRFYKKIDMTLRLDDCGLLNKLSEECSPRFIILFGSASRGEDIKESDVDIFLLTKEREIDIHSYEKVLARKINLHFSNDFGSLPKELKNNIINGILLRGYLKVF
ncbi:MAG: nucleotidyltransferase domain-containing protein [Candidatus Aenigmatarchaeota archaeon]